MLIMYKKERQVLRMLIMGDIVNDPAKTVCFTGHRPEKIPRGISGLSLEDALKREFRRLSEEAIDRGFDTFLCGVQRGADVWAGQQIVKLRQKVYPHIRLICVSPYRFEIRDRLGADGDDYRGLQIESDGFLYLHEDYCSGCYQERNRYMVDHSAMLIGAIANRKSGTGQTIAYARKRGLEVREIDLRLLAERT